MSALGSQGGALFALLLAGVAACAGGGGPAKEPPVCGNGRVETGESCDDQNADETDGCLASCASFDWCAGFAVESVNPALAVVGFLPGQLQLAASGAHGFLRVDGVPPSVTLDGSLAVVTSIGGCAPISETAAPAEGCATLTIEVPDAGLAPGEYALSVTNPVTAACSASATFTVVPPVAIGSVDVASACEDAAVSLTLTGTGFYAGTAVALVDSGGAEIPASDTTLVDATTLTATFPGLPPGTYDLLATNGPGGGSTLPAALLVHAAPVLLLVEEPVLFNAIDFPATFHAEGIQGGAVGSVELRRSGASSWETVPHAWDSGTPGKVIVTVPAGRVGDGEQFDYEVALTDGLGCRTATPGVVTLSRRVTIPGLEVRPPFGGSQPQDVSIVASDGASFQEGARAFLRPTAGAPRALGSVGRVDGANLTALLPAGLPPDDYELIVANPDGTLGTLPAGYRVTSAPAPIIEEISPRSVPSTDVPVRIDGQHFQAGLTVSLRCVPAAGGAEVTYSAIASLTSGVVTFSDWSSPPFDSVCVVRITNPDGAWAEASGLVRTNPAENIGPSVDTSTPLNVARRAPVALTGAVDGTRRFLYAIGGDGGSVSGALSSVEVLELSPFGTPAAGWRLLPEGLPSPRTLSSGAALGRFLYVVGGDGGAGAVGTGWRAEVLLPGGAPRIESAQARGASGAGLDAGLWYYRVSAVMDAAHPENPGGETLPSQPLGVRVPAWAPGPLELEVRWAPVPGAAKYRVYRTAMPGAPYSVAQFVAEVDAPASSLVDTGLAPVGGAAGPRRLGDLGAWASLPGLNVPRAELGLAIGRDPDDASARYLYATGGRTTGGGLLGSYEYLPITLGTDGGQATGATWTTGGVNTFTARRSHGAYAVDRAVTPLVSDAASWIFAGPGQDASGAGYVRQVQSARIQAGGTLGTWWTTSDGPSTAGYGAVAASSRLLFLGGPGPDAGRSAAAFSSMSPPPDVGATNSAGSLVWARERPGSALANGRIFTLGGYGRPALDVAPPAVLTSVESSPW